MLLSRFNVSKTSVKDSYFSKVASFFSGNFAKTNTVTGILSNFLLYAKFPEDFPIVDSVNVKISFH